MSSTAHFFVDEAGDLTLFNKRGVIVVGKEGVSHCFMVGHAYLTDPWRAEQTLRSLRQSLLADPYFRNVPSMQADALKTAICFHAKDDVPEVRREVFHCIARMDVKIQVAIRRKQSLAEMARKLNRQLGTRTDQNAVYDDLVKRLFKNCLHKHEANEIVFARRGKSDRQIALHQAIEKSKRNFEKKWGRPSDRPTVIRSSVPSDSAGLQVVDYMLWALQRMYERGEDRYFEMLRDKYRLVMDIDDVRNRPYGEWYSDSNPLEANNIKPVTS